MTDAELVAGFRDGTLAHLAHADHVRLAWLYLEAGVAARFAGDLARYAEARGARTKYSEAITSAWMARIEARRAARPAATWAEFAAANPDLLVFTRPAAAPVSASASAS